ncbi:MAG: ATP-dependent DNA helicase RecG [Pseudomonadales bacterium]|nr:ATP-dependent DNA helicase RecG [Pseudomonadales bacterium]
MKAGHSAIELPVSTLSGVGPKLTEKFAQLGIETLQDLLFHLPARYQDRTRVTPIGGLLPGRDAVICGYSKGSNIVFGRRRSLLCRLQDDTGTVTLRFFHFSKPQQLQFQAGAKLLCYGETRRGSSGLELYHPEITVLPEDAELNLDDRLTPIYPATEGLSQRRLRMFVAETLGRLEKTETLAELLPQALTQKMGMLPLKDSLLYLHNPPRNASLRELDEGQHPAQQRLAFEELLAHHLTLIRNRNRLRAHRATVFNPPASKIKAFNKQLGFTLTEPQARCVQELSTDLAQPRPMLRLLQGDVGSGKTVVSALAALQVIANGWQVALMAPTEILAEQHLESFSNWFEPLGYQVALLTGKTRVKARREILEQLQSGQTSILIGTHALFQQSVEYHQLGLIIIDEQHRFGVHQRLELRDKGSSVERGVIHYPHQLIMTATPIPRTLAMSAYADLDFSVIDGLPPGRKPVTTVVLSDKRRSEVVDRIKNICNQGRQVYWVCTLIEESENLQCQAAEDTLTQLQAALPELRIGLIHGRLKGGEKSEVMDAFKGHKLDLLVATTVIEVGVDVPNASLMVIENPERLGLAQLHQLRGRVGRGDAESFCLLLYHAPLSEHGKERLKVMRETSDGFVIAEKDLELRGPGEVLGTRQTGELQFRIADLLRDQGLLPEVKKAAIELMQNQPERTDALISRWLGEAEQYGNV